MTDIECAPPSGSGMISSMTPKLISSGEVIFRASVAYAHNHG